MFFSLVRTRILLVYLVKPFWLFNVSFALLPIKKE